MHLLQPFKLRLIKKQVWNFLDSNLRGIGQVVFANNPISGLIIVLALFMQSPWIGLMSCLGGISATSSAIALELEQNNIRNGIYGYNGVLVGATIATLSNQGNSNQNLTWVVPIVLFSALSTILTAQASNWWVKTFKTPYLSLPFNIMTLCFLNFVKFPPLFDFKQKAEIISGNSLEPIKLIEAIFIGFGQVFLADKFIVGVLIFMAIIFCTPIGAMLGLAGSVIGLITGLFLGASDIEIYSGIYCHNSILGAMAIGGIFYVFNQRSFFVALGCACLSVFTTQAIASLLGIFDLPFLTLPFCISTILLLILLKQIFPFLAPISLHAIANPEENRQLYLDARQAISYFRLQLERFMLRRPYYFLSSLTEPAIKTYLKYVFEAMNSNRANRISIQQAKLCIEEMYVQSEENDQSIEYLLKFISFEKSTTLDLEQFIELLLRYEYWVDKHQKLTDYFLPIHKHKSDFVTLEEVNLAIFSTGHTPLTQMQIQSLQKRTETKKWTWSQFVKVILVT